MHQASRVSFAQHRPPANPEFGLAIVVLLLTSFLPPPALMFAGFDYATAGGNPLEKIHPATYCAIFGLLGLAVFFGRGNLYFRILSERKGLVFYLLSWLVLQLYTIAFQSTPLSATIDTFLLPGVLFLILAALSRDNTGRVATLLDVIMALNSALAIFELASGFHLIPSAAASAKSGIIIFVNEWRPSAFMGHPLTGAAITGAYCLILLSNDRIRNNWWRFSLLGLNGLALLAYGGRMALAATAFCGACYLGANGLRLLANRPIRRDVAASLFLGPPFIALALVFLVEYGVLDKFIHRLSFDNGSAESRSAALDLIVNLPANLLIHGLSDKEALAVTTQYGVTSGVESFWLSFILRYGLIGCLLFFPGLFAFLNSLAKQTRPAAWLIIFYFLITISLSVSISSKNLSLVFVTALILCNYRQDRRAYEAAGRAPRWQFAGRDRSAVRWQPRRTNAAAGKSQAAARLGPLPR